jgi:DNA invertase Pin-like site-specific DNA recombinase
MNSKITADHLARGAVVYIRQSTPGQVAENTESQRRQYALVESAHAACFSSVTVIDDDLGRSGSGLTLRPGFQKLVASVCGGTIGAVYCIEASRLARNGRDWHHLIDLCALVGALVIDPDGIYDPRLINDRLLLGLKGTMSEYELSLLRQRGLAARDSKAQRGELRFTLPPGYCWDEAGRIVMDPDEHVVETIRLVLRKFAELGSARQILLWANQSALKLPVVVRNLTICRIEWQAPAYHTVLQIIRNPIYAGAYAFGRTTQRTLVVDGRARKTSGHRKSMPTWNVLIRDNHDGYITWEQFEENQKMILENAHMKKRAARKSARGGRALLTGMVRCGRCGRMMRVFYGMRSDHPHRYQCRGDESHTGSWRCIGIGGVRVDRAIAVEILNAVSDRGVEAAILAADQLTRAGDVTRHAANRELEQAQYEVALAERRYNLVDPAKRHVARELEARWNTALERVAQIQQRIANLDSEAALRPKIDRAALMRLGHDLPAAWNAPTTDARTRQRLTHILIKEVVIDLDDQTNEAVVTVHWTGGRHTELRVPRVKCGRYPEDRRPNPVEVIRKLGGQWPDRELAVTMNRMRCKSPDGKSWTTLRVRELRERLEIPEFDPSTVDRETISADETASRLKISIGSVHLLIRQGVLPATQLMPCAPWKVPVDALESEAVKIGVREIIARRPRNFAILQGVKTLTLPGF